MGRGSGTDVARRGRLGVLLLVLVGLALLLSLLLGGDLRRLGGAHIRLSPLILLSLLLQIVIFTRWWQSVVPSDGVTSALYVVSLLLLLMVGWLNRRLPGLSILLLGLASNALVIFVNGGSMPASLWAMRTAGIVDSQVTFEAMRTANSSIAGSGTPLWFLGDVLAIPSRFPLANVYSVGDVLITIGGIWFVVANTRPARPDAPNPADR